MTDKRCTFKQDKWHCGSFAFNLYSESIEQGDYCDKHYWQVRAVKAEAFTQAVPDETLTIAYQSGFFDGKKQRQLVESTGNEWFEWWRVSKIADETEAEIDFGDFLIIAQAVVTKLKEDNK